ncbi:50S ribosomal protein L37ae [Candidatus Woesearchaeota archaeon]|nr:MAG: 50S ribosomal protein L37ae [Candidatus Woesearchaeota archaeon]
MVKKKKFGSVKRFGPRYGRRTKDRVSEVEALRKKKHSCPFCKKNKVKRLAAGIWYCSKCNCKFTSKAYSVSSKKKVVSEA